jgi:hypothetical protein
MRCIHWRWRYVPQRFSLALRVILLGWSVWRQEVIELSTHQNFGQWLYAATAYYGWARSASRAGDSGGQVQDSTSGLG